MRLSALNTGGLTPREGSFNVNGLRSTFNNFLIDGVDNNAYGTSNQGFSNQVMQPPPDALAEFRVVTNNMSAEYGRSGGATINVAYKSGTNRFSGAAWEFFRDTSMNAEGFFKSPAGKPELKRNQFGFVVGGPILRNRAFFFTDFEGFRQDREVVTFSTIATEAQRQGIFAVDVRNPFTGDTYPAGTPIPMTPFARASSATCRPRPVRARANNYRTLQLFTNDTDKYNGKVDVTISPTISLFGRYGYRDVDIFDNPPIPLPSGGAATARPTSPTSSSPPGSPGRGRRTRCSRRGSATPTPSRARTRRRSVPRAPRRCTASRACRAIRASPAACPTRPSRAIRSSAGRRPTRSGNTPAYSIPR